jgi:hypothetical protein
MIMALPAWQVESNERLGPHGLDGLAAIAGERAGLHDPKSARIMDKFTPRCCRHSFITHAILLDSHASQKEFGFLERGKNSLQGK